MNAHARFPKTRPTFWLAIVPDTLEPMTYPTREEAYRGWQDYGSEMDFYQIDPDGHWTGLNDDFEEWGIEDRADARAMRRHEASLIAGRV